MKPFSRTYTVRGYEVDASRTMPMPIALSFLEQLRWEWIADPEWGLDEGVHNGFFFVVRHQVLEMVERPRFGERLRVEGRLEKVGRSQVIVRHRLFVEERQVGHARVHGVWLGPNRRLARIPDTSRTLGRKHAALIPPWNDPLGHPTDTVIGEHPSFLDAPRRVYRRRGLELIQADFEPTHRVQLQVRPSDCDVFQHVNASQYLRYCEDALLQTSGQVIGNRVLLDYSGEALAGDALSVESAQVDTHWHSRIQRGGQTLCSVVIA